MDAFGRNVIGLFLISLVYLMIVYGPESSHEYADLYCGADRSSPVDRFENMKLCQAEMSRSPVPCGCIRPENTFAKLYYLLFVPAAFASVGLLVTDGSFWARVGWLNLGIVAGGVVSILNVTLSVKYYDPEAPAFFMLDVLILMLVSTAFFIALYFLARQWTQLIGARTAEN